mmetsp:Transcript_21565/g.37591  ORF Transcript_21565/g.37591 Transcript_21565/m.37591 type:complete len:84 (-) Transcript_21565:25-276(-)
MLSNESMLSRTPLPSEPNESMLSRTPLPSELYWDTVLGRVDTALGDGLGLRVGHGVPASALLAVLDANMASEVSGARCNKGKD